jgi:predicted Ser/Thr protein kinase
MAPIPACPDEHELLPVATGDPALEAIEQHLAGCPDCRERVERLRAGLAALRRDFEGAVDFPPTEPDPPVNPAREPSNGGATLDWTSDPSATAAPEPLGPDAVAAARGRAEARPERPGAIGRYLIVEMLGSGTQGEVYRVIHPRLGRDMVLKLGRQPVGEDEHASLVAEGRLLTDLEHINLVKIYDLDFHNDRPFLVMEYVHGRNLEDYARDEPIPPRRAAALVAKLAGALAMVHRRGVIHRDIKPRNILIDESGEPRLIDFGLARLRHAWSERTDHTWGGTLAYMAPEQARLEHDRIGPRSDVFGLGAVFYFLLTGRPPFVGETADEIWARARRCDFDAGALRAAKVPRRLERVCLKALAADPAQRYPTADQFRRALERFLRRPYVVLIQAVAVLVLATVGLWFVWDRSGADRPSPASRIGPEREAKHPPAEATPLRIAHLHVEHLARSGENEFEPRGRLGERSFVARPGDDVTVQAELTEPAYAYLIAFRPDGVDEICDPEDPEAIPPKADRPSYPPETRVDLVYRLDNGAGLYAFAVVASRAPLPSYRQWRDQQGSSPWSKGLTGAPGVVWWHDGARLHPLTAGDAAGQRGQGATIRGGGDAVAKLVAWLRARPGVDAVAVKAFPVPAGVRP